MKPEQSDKKLGIEIDEAQKHIEKLDQAGFHSQIDSAQDAIVCIDNKGLTSYWNSGPSGCSVTRSTRPSDIP